MKDNGRVPAKTPNVAQSVSDLAHNVIELTELQTQLLMLDIKKSSQRTRTCLVWCAVGICLLLGSIPVALFALAELLAEQLEWSHAAAFAVAALVGLALAAVAAGAAWSYVKKGVVSAERSREEFSRNIAWLKSTLRNRGEPHSTEKNTEAVATNQT